MRFIAVAAKNPAGKCGGIKLNNFEAKHPRSGDGKFTEKARKESGLSLGLDAVETGAELVKPTMLSDLGRAGDEAIARMRKDNPDLPNGDYGPEGWTKKTGVAGIMESYVNPRMGIGDFKRFTNLEGEDAAKLLKILPTKALEDRQNDSPTLGSMLAACAANPGKVHLSGYMIGDSRVDERVSVDTILIADSAASEYRQLDAKEAFNIWEQYQEKLSLDSDCPPDEVHGAEESENHPRSWVFWWD